MNRFGNYCEFLFRNQICRHPLAAIAMLDEFFLDFRIGPKRNMPLRFPRSKAAHAKWR